MTEMLLEARGIWRRFGGVIALRDVTLVQNRGETLGLIGPNGSGKTTFVNIATGHLRVHKGSIQFRGISVTSYKPYQVAAAGLTRTYQAVRVYNELTVQENINIALLNARYPLTALQVSQTMDWLQIGHRLEIEAKRLTLFEQRCLELLMRLVQSPKLVMLDEPVGGLSASEVRLMVRLLSELKVRCDLFVIEHTMRVIRELADRVVVLVAGEQIADGRPRDVLADQRVIDRYLGSADA